MYKHPRIMWKLIAVTLFSIITSLYCLMYSAATWYVGIPPEHYDHVQKMRDRGWEEGSTIAEGLAPLMAALMGVLGLMLGWIAVVGVKKILGYF